MDDYDPYTRLFTHKLVPCLAAFVFLGYGWLALEHPLVWAVATAGLFVLGAGLLTSKIVLRIENKALMWAMTPIFGLLWLLFFYLLWTLRDVAM
jgi:hypothetical protein